MLISCFDAVFGYPTDIFLMEFVVTRFSAITGFGMKSERSTIVSGKMLLRYTRYQVAINTFSE